MTFLTPTLLAGDRSLVDVLVHELAHSWTGNLVTNADMDHFWLNEGFTVWAERRLLEALHGRGGAGLAWAIGEKALEESLARFGQSSPLTRLRTELAGTDPDDAFSSIPYEKGSGSWLLLERRPAAPASTCSCARTWRASVHLDHHRAVPRLSRRATARRRGEVDARAWLYEPGCPPTRPSSAPLCRDALVALASRFAPGGDRPRRTGGGLEPDRDASLPAEPSPRARP